jgi:hypothetical protein
MDLLDTIAAGSSCGWFLTCQPCPCVCAPSRRSTLTSIYRLAPGQRCAHRGYI